MSESEFRIGILARPRGSLWGAKSKKNNLPRWILMHDDYKEAPIGFCRVDADLRYLLISPLAGHNQWNDRRAAPGTESQ